MEIVFGAAEKGILQRAKSEGYLSSDRFDDIITLDLGLDMGDIQKTPINDERKHLMEASFYSDLWAIPDDQDFLPHWERTKNEYQKFSALAQTGGDVRIWYSSTPDSLCGFMYVVSELSRSACKISAVRLPGYSHGAVPKPLIGWGNVRPDALPDHLKQEREICTCEQSEISFVWKKLKDENAPLCASVNGYLMGVPETFYDPFILSELDHSPFEVAPLILRVLHAFPLGIGAFTIAARLKEMIRLGTLDICSKNHRFYNSILQKA